MRRNVLFYLIAFAMLIVVFFCFNKAYKAFVSYSELTDRYNTINSSFQNLSRQLKNGAIINPELTQENSSTTVLFFVDSASIFQQIAFLKKTVRDSINVDAVKRIEPVFKSEISWILKSNLPDSLLHHKSASHIASFHYLDSFINIGIKRTEDLVKFHQNKVHETLSVTRTWSIIFIILTEILLIYTTLNLFKQFSKRKSKEAELEYYNKLLKEASIQQALLASIIISSDDAIISKKLDGTITSWNPGAEKMFGYSEKEMIGNSIHILIPHTLQDEENNIIAKIKKGEHVEHYETIRVKKDGKYINVALTVSPILNEEGNIIGASKIARDITEKKDTEETLRNSLKEISDYKYALDESSIIAITDQKGIIKYVNDNFCKISKYTKEELIGHDHKIINSGYHSKEFIKNLWVTIANGKIWKGELKNKAKDGTIYWVDTTIVPFIDQQGKPYQYVAIRADITNRKKSEEEILQLNIELDRKVLERTKELLQAKNQLSETLEKVSFLASIAENIEDPVIATSNDIDHNIFTVTKWNKPAEKLFEWKSEEVIGRNAVEVFRTEYPHETREQIFEALKTKGVWQGEIIYKTKSGKPIDVLSTISYIKDDEGNIIGNLVLARDITDRKKAEIKLKEFEHFFNNSNDLSCIANTEGYFEIINPSFIKLFGYTKNELSKNPFIEFVHPDDIAATLQQYDKLKSGATVLHFINRYRKSDGNYLWLEWNATPNNETGKLYCIARDITDRKKAEEALRKLNEDLEERVKERTAEVGKNEKRFRALIENNYDIITLLDQTFSIIYRSPSAVRITGWADEEVLNFPGTKNMHPDDLKKAGNVVSQIMDNPGLPINVLFRNLHKNGHYLWIEGTLTNLLKDDNVKAILFNYRDVTERVEAEEKLVSSEKRYRSLIENNYDVITLVDESLKVLYRSPSSTRVTGWTDEDICNNVGINNVHPDDWECAKNNFAEALANPGKPISFLIRNRHKDGHYIWLEGTTTNMLDYEFVKAVVYNFRDVTEKKIVEENLKKLNIDLQKRARELAISNTELEQFAYVASHDLQEPLRMVTSFLTQLEKKYGDVIDDKAKQYIAFAVDGAKRMRQIILDLLEFSRVSKTEDNLEEIDLNDLIEEITILYRKQIEEKKAVMHVDDLPIIHSNKAPLRQVFQNLISNALKYTKRGTSALIQITVKDLNTHWEFAIKDNGIGIEKEYFDKIFIIFQRLHNKDEYSGTGMGLAITKKIIESLGGKIWLESEIEEGSTFYFTILKQTK